MPVVARETSQGEKVENSVRELEGLADWQY